MIRPVATVDVTPDLPPSLERLRELAITCAGRGTRPLPCSAVLTAIWEKTHSNPVLMLTISQDVLLTHGR